MNEERSVIKATVSKELKEKIKNRAKQEGMPISTLIILAVKKYCNFPETENREDN